MKKQLYFKKSNVFAKVSELHGVWGLSYSSLNMPPMPTDSGVIAKDIQNIFANWAYFFINN